MKERRKIRSTKIPFDENSVRGNSVRLKFFPLKIPFRKNSVTESENSGNQKSSGEKSEGEIPSSRSLEDPTINRLPRQREINDWSGTIIWNVIVFHPPHVENFKDR